MTITDKYYISNHTIFKTKRSINAAVTRMIGTLHAPNQVTWLNEEQVITHGRWGTAVTQWLRCCATNRKVVGSNPAGVIGILH